MEGVKFAVIPKYDECSVKNLYPKVKDDPEVKRFMPDRFPQGKLPDRDYFFNVLNTVHPDYVSKMVEHANK